MQDDHQRQREREGDRVQKAVRYVDEFQWLLDEVGDRRFTDPSEQDRTDRDAQLGCGQHQRQMFACLDDRARPALALLLECLEAVTTSRDQ